MKTINGEWIMLGCSADDPDCLRTPDDLIYFVHRIGFLPLFSNAVSGFSVEEHTLTENWWTGDAASDPWEWRHILAGSDGYDFDALSDEGFASNRSKKVMVVEHVWEKIEIEALNVVVVNGKKVGG